MAWMYCLLFNPSLVGDYLGRFQFGAITNKPVTDLCVQVFVNRSTEFCERRFSFFWDKCPRAQFLGCMVVAYLVLKELAKMFSRMAVSFYIPPRIV